MTEVIVCTSDGQILIEQDRVDGRIATTNQIVLDTDQIPKLVNWLKAAWDEIEC
jgi:short-subunit dehydrogenase involved in D-alanine esterification of teichoic acids